MLSVQVMIPSAAKIYVVYPDWSTKNIKTSFEIDFPSVFITSGTVKTRVEKKSENVLLSNLV